MGSLIHNSLLPQWLYNRLTITNRNVSSVKSTVSVFLNRDGRFPFHSFTFPHPLLDDSSLLGWTINWSSLYLLLCFYTLPAHSLLTAIFRGDLWNIWPAKLVSLFCVQYNPFALLSAFIEQHLHPYLSSTLLLIFVYLVTDAVHQNLCDHSIRV